MTTKDARSDAWMRCWLSLEAAQRLRFNLLPAEEQKVEDGLIAAELAHHAEIYAALANVSEEVGVSAGIALAEHEERQHQDDDVSLSELFDNLADRRAERHALGREDHLRAQEG